MRAAARRRGAPLAAAGLALLLAFQAWAYAGRLPLSLGPRVILQPWLLERGLVPYRDLADLHTPLMPLALAALRAAVPDGPALAQGVLVALLSLTTALAGVAGWRRAGPWAGLATAATVALWSPAFGFGKLWHESFLAPLYLVLFLGARPAPRRPARAALLAGLAGGVAVLVKQHAALVVAAYAAWSAWARWPAHRSPRALARELGCLGLGVLLPAAAVAAWQAARAGSLDALLYWTAGYSLASDYRTLAAQAPTALQLGVVGLAGALLPAGLAAAVDARRRGDGAWQPLGPALALLAASAATAYPLFEMFHLQPALPLLALGSWLGVAYWVRHGGRGRAWVRLAAAAAAAAWLLVAGRGYLPALAAGGPPAIAEYSDLVPLAQQVREAAGPGACPFLFPDDEATSNLYYLLGCPPPAFWVFHYPWYLTGPVEARILAGLEASAPGWAVRFPGRWEAERRAPRIAAYLEAHYERAAPLDWAQGEAWLLRRRP